MNPEPLAAVFEIVSATQTSPCSMSAELQNYKYFREAQRIAGIILVRISDRNISTPKFIPCKLEFLCRTRSNWQYTLKLCQDVCQSSHWNSLKSSDLTRLWSRKIPRKMEKRPELCSRAEGMGMTTKHVRSVGNSRWRRATHADTR